MISHTPHSGPFVHLAVLLGVALLHFSTSLWSQTTVSFIIYGWMVLYPILCVSSREKHNNKGVWEKRTFDFSSARSHRMVFLSCPFFFLVLVGILGGSGEKYNLQFMTNHSEYEQNVILYISDLDIRLFLFLLKF